MFCDIAVKKESVSIFSSAHPPVCPVPFFKVNGNTNTVIVINMFMYFVQISRNKSVARPKSALGKISSITHHKSLIKRSMFFLLANCNYSTCTHDVVSVNNDFQQLVLHTTVTSKNALAVYLSLAFNI